MTQTQLTQANKINKAIEDKKQELKTFKGMMGFGGEVPERITISNAAAPYMPMAITNKVVTMVVLDTILAQYNDEIANLEAELESI